MEQKLVPDLFLILDARNYLRIRYSERGLSKSLKLLFLSNLIPLTGKIMKRKRGLELVTNYSSGGKTLIMHYLTKFVDVV